MIISLDFESYYGISSGYDYSSRNINYYSQIPIVVHRLLELFEQYNISATWATVGLLGLESKEEFDEYAPKLIPGEDYLFPFNHNRFSDNVHSKKFRDWLSFPKLIEEIHESENQEIGSHTFMHYFCNEKGTSYEIVNADITAHKRFFKEKFNIEMDSIVFPHDQFPQDFDMGELKFDQVRLPFQHKAYTSHSLEIYGSFFNKAYRFLDRYIDLSGPKNFNCTVANSRIIRIPQSRFLSFNNFSFLRTKALSVIKKELLDAAKSGSFYHIWWHPHNMCRDVENSFNYLKSVLDYFYQLHDEFGWESYNLRGYSTNVKSSA